MADGLPCAAASRPEFRGGLARGEDGTRFAHVPPRNNRQRRDDIAEARAEGDARGEDAIGRTDRKY